MAEAKAAEGVANAASARPALSIGLILALLNTVAILGAAGMLVYTKLLFKRPQITEHAERERLAKEREKTTSVVPGVVSFEPVTMNIAPTPARPAALEGGGPQIRGKLHYATVGFSLEIRDAEKRAQVEDLRPKIMDELLSVMGRKSFNDLSSAQGRYLLRTQVIEFTNRLIAKANNPEAEEPAKAASKGPASNQGAYREGLVTNVFFTQFIVQ